jgi:hypothetical protein
MKLANAKIVAALAEDHTKHKELYRLLSDTRLRPRDLKIRLICNDEGEYFGPAIDIPLDSALGLLDSRRGEIEEALKRLGVEL